MIEYLQILARALEAFVNTGIPAIRAAQQTNGNNLLFLSTIATFLSGVTATTVQLSYSRTGSLVDDVCV